jgi:hypothetical protein
MIRLTVSIPLSGGFQPAEDRPVIRISWPDAEVARLDHVLCTTSDAKLRHHVQIVLMAHRGRRHTDIVAETGTGSSARSVQRWLNA